MRKILLLTLLMSMFSVSCQNDATKEEEKPIKPNEETGEVALLKKRVTVSNWADAEVIDYTYGNNNFVSTMKITTQKPKEDLKLVDIINVKYVYNSKNQVIEMKSEVNEDGKKLYDAIVTYNYNNNGFITSADFKQIINGGGKGSKYTTYYKYNSRGLVKKSYDKDDNGNVGRSYTYEYDEKGNMIKRTESNNSKNTIVCTFDESKNPLYHCFPKKYRIINVKGFMNNEVYANPNNMLQQTDSNVNNKDGKDWVYKYSIKKMEDSSYPKVIGEKFFEGNNYIGGWKKSQYTY